MNIVNLTPHTLNVQLPDGTGVSFPASGAQARVSVKNIAVGDIDGIPVTTAVYGAIEGLPASEPGVVYLVSMLVGQIIQRQGSRDDVYGPDSGPTAIRENGQIVAVRGFIKY